MRQLLLPVQQPLQPLRADGRVDLKGPRGGKGAGGEKGRDGRGGSRRGSELWEMREGGTVGYIQLQYAREIRWHQAMRLAGVVVGWQALAAFTQAWHRALRLRTAQRVA